MEFIKNLFKKKQEVPLWWVIAIAFFVFAGMIDTTYLSIKQLSGSAVVCNIYELNSCGTVLSSQYAKFLGIPLSIWGLGYYFSLFVFIVTYAASKERKFFNILFGLSIFGFLFSMRLVYLQIYVLENLCFYCMLSALFSTMILIVNSVYFYFSRKE